MHFAAWLRSALSVYNLTGHGFKQPAAIRFDSFDNKEFTEIPPALKALREKIQQDERQFRRASLANPGLWILEVYGLELAPRHQLGERPPSTIIFSSQDSGKSSPLTLRMMRL